MEQGHFWPHCGYCEQVVGDRWHDFYICLCRDQENSSFTSRLRHEENGTLFFQWHANDPALVNTSEKLTAASSEAILTAIEREIMPDRRLVTEEQAQELREMYDRDWLQLA